MNNNDNSTKSQVKESYISENDDKNENNLDD